MGVGHAALAVGASRFAPRLNVGWLVFAALLADFLLGIFAILGLEHSTAPPDFATHHYLWFTFPYSHGLAAMTLWAAMAAFLIARLHPADRNQVVIVIFGLVLSHFALDALVHEQGLPLFGENSFKVGLGLWKHLPLELLLETAMAVAGVAMFLPVAGKDCPAISRFGVSIVIFIFALLTWTQISLRVAPRTDQLAIGWIVMPLVLSGVTYALDRARLRETAA